MFSAVRESWCSERSPGSLYANVVAGVTVGLVALPLSMAFAIAIGVPPQHGLYAAMVGSIVVALTGGSSVNVSGPTAAFVVVLLPIVQAHGLGGLLVSGFLAGLILLVMGVAGFGRLVKVVPYPVTIGFTAGIGVVIATLAIRDFLGLRLPPLHGHYLENLMLIVQALPSLQWSEALVGGVTLAVMVVWPRWRFRVPGHLVALLAGSVGAWVLGCLSEQWSVATIGTRFHYPLGEGATGNGIPPFLPDFAWPWQLPGADGQPVGLSFGLIKTLMASAVTIAVLGSLESLLCSVVADGMSGKQHNPNDELIGQGVGNLVAPLFGGIPVTAAMTRTTGSIRAGGSSSVAAITHGVFILLTILLLAPVLDFIPMASMAALLLVVAWNMADAGHVWRTLRIAPRDDVVTLLVCFLLTVLFDMTVAVAVGMGLAAVLFIRRSIDLTESHLIRWENREGIEQPKDVVIYDINGPLFFGSAQKAMKNITQIAPDVKVVILDMSEVTMMDMSAMVAMASIANDLAAKRVSLVINNLNTRLVVNLRRMGVRYRPGRVAFSRTLPEALGKAERMRG